MPRRTTAVQAGERNQHQHRTQTGNSDRPNGQLVSASWLNHSPVRAHVGKGTRPSVPSWTNTATHSRVGAEVPSGVSSASEGGPAEPRSSPSHGKEMLTARVCPKDSTWKTRGGGGAVPDEQREMLSPAGRSAELLLRATGTELLEGRTKEGGEKPTPLHNESQSLAGSKSTSAKRTSAISLRKPTFAVPPLSNARHRHVSSQTLIREDKNASLHRSRLQMWCNATQVGSPSPRRVLCSSIVEISSKQGPFPLLKC